MGVNGNAGDRVQSDGKGGLQWGPSAQIHVETARTPSTRTEEWKDIPDKVHMMTMILDGLVTRGNFKVNLGAGSTYATSGYKNTGGASPAVTDGFSIPGHATRPMRGFIMLANAGFNIWNMSYHLVEIDSTAPKFHRGSGLVTLSGRMTRTRLLTTRNITAGRVNLTWQVGV